MEKSNPNKRLPEFDIAKGIAILCVILGHLGIKSINRIVFLFHMPLFFLISGYFLSLNDSFEQFSKKKFKQCIIPYIATCVAICIASVPVSMYFHQDVGRNLLKWFCGSIYGSGTLPGIIPGFPSFIGALWFLEALFFGCLIVRYLIERFSLKDAAIIILIVAYIGYATARKAWLPFNIQAGCTAAGFIYLGYIFRRESFVQKTINLPLLLSLIFIVVWCVKFFNGFWLVQNYFGNGWMDVIGACAASYLILLACRIIATKDSFFSKTMQWYGKNSIVVLAFHIIELNLIPKAGALSWINGFGFSSALSIVILVFLKIAWASLGIVLVNHAPVLKRIFFPGKS